MLDLEGYTVEVAHDGGEALYKVKHNPPGLILLDIMMPRMDGFAVAADLERQGLRSIIPLIVLTADGNAAAKTARIGAGPLVVRHSYHTPTRAAAARTYTERVSPMTNRLGSTTIKTRSRHLQKLHSWHSINTI